MEGEEELDAVEWKREGRTWSFWLKTVFLIEDVISRALSLGSKRRLEIGNVHGERRKLRIGFQVIFKKLAEEIQRKCQHQTERRADF